MATVYGRQELWQALDRAAQDMTSFYRQRAVNYRGRTSDSGEWYTEVIADWCLENLPRFD